MHADDADRGARGRGGGGGGRSARGGRGGRSRSSTTNTRGSPMPQPGSLSMPLRPAQDVGRGLPLLARRAVGCRHHGASRACGDSCGRGRGGRVPVRLLPMVLRREQQTRVLLVHGVLLLGGRDGGRDGGGGGRSRDAAGERG